jgi:hypothetical protein
MTRPHFALQPALKRKREYCPPFPASMSLGTDQPSRSTNRRIDSLSRERESIRRILAQAELDRVQEDIKMIKKNLDSIEKSLSGGSH